MRLNALLLLKMNKYLIYYWSYIHNCYWPFFSCSTLAIAKAFIRYMRFSPLKPFIIVPNPHPRYVNDSK